MGFPICCCSLEIYSIVTSYLSKGFSYDTIISVSLSARKDLEWWLSTTFLPTRSLYSFPPDISLILTQVPQFEVDGLQIMNVPLVFGLK